MSFFKGYLKERWKRLLMLLLFACIFAFSFWVYRLPVRAVIYPCALCLLFGAVFAAYDITKACIAATSFSKSCTEGTLNLYLLCPSRRG